MELMDYTTRCFTFMMACKALDALYFQKIILHQRRGSWSALWAAAPVLLFNLVIPFLFDHRRCDVGIPAHAAAVLAWISNFKVLAFVSGRGPHYSKGMSFRDIFGCLMTPATIAYTASAHDASAAAKKTDEPTPDAKAQPTSNGHGSRLVVTEDPLPVMTILQMHGRRLLMYMSALGVIWAGLRYSAALRLPLWAVQGLYGAGFLAFHLFTHTPWECISSLLTRRPPIHNGWRPWAPRSIADFWGNRWNRTGSDLGRWVVYEPIVTGRWRVAPGTDLRPVLRAAPTWRRTLGVLCTFAVSGLAHELIWASMTGTPLWSFLVYFLANGVVVVGEGLAREWLWRHRVDSRKQAADKRQNGSLNVVGSMNGHGSGSRSSSEQSGLKAAASSTGSSVLLSPYTLVLQAVQSIAVFAVVMGLGGWLVWPRLASSIGEKFLGVGPGLTFAQLHARLFAR
ncbi:hypothetical protein N2152v2_000853 [Parachlorella kessleri]